MDYRVKILQPNQWRDHPVGRLDISVGQPYHEGEKLRAAIEWAQGKFSHVIISVADTLQRHNLIAEGMDDTEALRTSYNSGSEWIDRNSTMLSGCTVTRWESRLTHPLYRQYMRHTLDLLRDYPPLLADLERAADDYAVRKGLVKSTCRMSYLIEELAVFAMLFRLEPAADIYPGTLLGVWDHPAYKPHASFTRIDFTRRSA